MVNRLEEEYTPASFGATKSIEVGIYERTTITSIDYAGRELVWMPSAGLRGIGSLPTQKSTQIIVRGLCVPGADEVVRLKLRQESDFTRLWIDYPKRRKPTAEDTQEAEGRPV